MSGPVIVDVHMHVFDSKEVGRQAKESYEGWEYGDLAAHTPYSPYDGDPPSALAAIEKAGLYKGVAVNLYRPCIWRQATVDDLPDSLSAAERQAEKTDLYATIAEGLKKSNIWICGLAREHPQMVPFIGLDPWVMDPREAVAHLQDMVENHGARGIKVHPVLQRFFIGDRRMWPVYRACSEMGVAVLAHSGPTRGDDQYGDPRAFADVLKSFPDLRVVLAHMGGGAWRQASEIAAAFPNALFDCCEIIEWLDAPNAPTQRQLAELIKDVGPERVMMGSDFPWWDPSQCVERIMGLPLLSAEEKEAILGASAVRILGL